MYAVIIVAVFLLSFLYTYYRGKERLKASRQLFDHSTFLAPVNMFMTGFSKLPNQPFFDVAQFPELKPLQDNWQVFVRKPFNSKARLRRRKKIMMRVLTHSLNVAGNVST